MTNVLPGAWLSSEVAKLVENDRTGVSGLGLETTDGRHFGFCVPIYHLNDDSRIDWIQPGDGDQPQLVWQDRASGPEHNVCLSVTNTTSSPLRIRRLVVWQECIPPGAQGEIPAFYQPGWQTWSQSGVTVPPDQEPAPVKAIRFPGLSGNPYIFPSLTGLERESGAQVWGFISAFQQTGLIVYHPQTHLLEASVYTDDITLEPGEMLTSEELLVTQGPTLPLALERYAVQLAERMRAVADPTRELWWCTWYERFAKIDAAFVLNNLEWIRRNRSYLPVAGILVDQGHEMNMGDWLDTNQQKFPGGLKPVIDAVHAAGLQFGLWLAPLFFSAKSTLYLAHPDWAVRDESGAPLVAKVLEGIEHYGLDATHPQARQWLAGMIEEAITTLGVDLFKFDYLYAGAMRGQRYHPDVTSVQAYRQGMEVINAVLSRYPSVRTLGCGAPFTASVGLFGLMRTATDTVPYWPQPGDERYNKDGTQSGQSLTLQSLVSRAWMKDALWSPDSDAFVLRANNNQLTLPEVYTQAILYWMNERFMTIGDDLTRLEADRLRIYAWLYPALGPWVRAVGSDLQHRPNVFLFEPQDRPAQFPAVQLLVLVNWTEEPREVIGCPVDRECHLVDTLTGEYLGQLEQGARLTRRLPPHGSQVIRMTEAAPHPQLIGTSLHIAGGLADIQMETWVEAEGMLSVVFRGEGDHQGQVLITVPYGYRLTSSGISIHRNIISIPLHLAHQQTCHLTLNFDRRV